MVVGRQQPRIEPKEMYFGTTNIADDRLRPQTMCFCLMGRIGHDSRANCSRAPRVEWRPARLEAAGPLSGFGPRRSPIPIYPVEKKHFHLAFPKVASHI